MRLESQKVDVLMKQLIKSHVQSRAVTCGVTEDAKHGKYLNLSKNMIKIKCSSIFSLFVSAIS